MKPIAVFGYGSLVNSATHSYAQARPATVHGWRRVWRHIAGRQVALLTVEPDDTATIEGLIAVVPTKDWPALNERERNYLFEPLHISVTEDVGIYHAPPDLHPPAPGELPILLSYLDVVVQGYCRIFGPDGVDRFFQTTHGWTAPILNDRDNPIYPRHQVLTASERKMVDTALARFA